MSNRKPKQERSYFELMEARKELLFAGDNAAAERLLDQARKLQSEGLVTMEEAQAAAYL